MVAIYQVLGLLPFLGESLSIWGSIALILFALFILFLSRVINKGDKVGKGE